jgi:hypothetical protein
VLEAPGVFSGVLSDHGAFGDVDTAVDHHARETGVAAHRDVRQQ